MRPFSVKQYSGVGIVLLLLLGAVTAYAAIPSQTPVMIYPLAPPDPPAQDVPTLTFFQWSKVLDATVYAYILRPVGGNAPPQFTNGVGGAPPEEIWIQPTLSAGTEYTLGVQGCGDEDINTCGPATTLDFKTKDPVVNPPPCSDGEDNDGDGLIDYGLTNLNDPGCDSPNDNDESGGGPGGGGTLENPISAQNLTELFNKIFSFLFGLAIFIVPVIVIYAAFLMLMGGGDPVKLAKGRMILLWTAIAFTIILLSRGLPAVFQSLL